MSITSVVNDTVTSVSVINALKPLPPTITNYSVGGLDDTALDPAGGQTVQINGTGFLAGATITFDGSAVAVVTYVNPNRLTFTSPAKSAGTYTIYVVNPDGGTAIYIPGIIYSVLPTWTTSAGTLGSYYETTSISNTVVASGDAPITYSLYSGSLPTGSTLYANGVITGTAPVDSSSTTYSFTIEAIDAQLQGSTRSFSLTINTDVVTWVSPANATTYTSAVDSAIANVTLSATDAAGYAVTYTANALPTGLSLTGANISGTPTVIADSSTLLTATAATTNRTATRTINWSITVANDPYFEYNTLLIPGASTTFVDDASTNNFAVTIFGDTKPNNNNPYTPGYYSNYFGVAGTDFLSFTDASNACDLGNATASFEAWVYLTASTSVIINKSGGVASYSTTNGIEYTIALVSSVFTMYYNASGTYGTLASGSSSALNTWHHIAIASNSTTLSMYVNGTRVATATAGITKPTTRTTMRIANDLNGTGLAGYISNIRIISGANAYDASQTTITVPTSPLTAISGTSLLTCQSNRFIDNSTNNFTITVAGNTSINSFDPFVPNSSYSTYGSGYFDGTGDYLSATGTALNLVTGDFTVEAWVYIVAGSTYQFIIGSSDNAAGYMMIGINVPLTPTSTIAIGRSGISWPVQFGNSITFASNTWYHIAITRSGTTNRAFINGVQLGANVTDSTSWSFPSNTMWAGFQTGGTAFNGYMTDLRIVKGTAVYTSAFTPPSAPLTAIANTSLLTLQNNQSVNNNIFLDNSSNNFLVTRNGNATQGTFSPYGGNWSNYFDGTGDNLSLATATALGTGNTTVEFWFYPTDSSATYRAIYDSRSTVNTDTGYAIFQYGLTIEVYGNGLKVATSASAFTVNNWVYVALVRTSGTCQLYINGVASGSSGTYSANLTSTVRKIGDSVNTLFPFVGYISNLREVTSALYSGTFTPSATPLTPITNTSLLTCQSNRLIDNSINNFAITKNGDVSVQRFSPFNPSSLTPTSYSGYFDGTGDYLSVADSASLELGSSDFCIEGWYLPQSFSSALSLVSKRANTTSTGAVVIYANPSDSTLTFYASANGSTYFWSGATIGTMVINQWNHFTVYRSGNNWYGAINGVVSSMGSNANGIYNNTSAWTIGGDTNGNYANGYISNLRIVIGSSVYGSSNFTPPTSPLTAISGTSLLTLQSTTFIDNSTNNFTISAFGNSQPTQQNPFGYTSATTNGYTVSTIGGSGYFDGTGDYLNLGNQTALHLSSGNFTVEMWLWKNANTTYMTACGDFATASTNTFQILGDVNGTKLGVYSGASNSFVITSVSSIPINAWTHIALVRSSTTLTLYINGVSDVSAAYSTNLNASTSFFIGHTPELIAGRYWNGYISDFRMVKGTAIYTSNFVPPAQPLTAVQNTVSLLNMTSAGIYDASMMTTMETVGDAKLSTAISKFGGSSMSFDGTGDYLSSSDNLSLGFGSGAFTVEGWIYLNNTSGTKGIVFGRGNNSFGFRVGQGYNGNVNGLNIVKSGVADLDYCAFTFATNTWYHIAVVRSGTTIYFFVNGTQQTTLGSGAGSFNYINPTSGYYIGCNNDTNEQFAGYIDDLRITKGYARYTSNFTAPTVAFPIY